VTAVQTTALRQTLLTASSRVDLGVASIVQRHIFGATRNFLED